MDLLHSHEDSHSQRLIDKFPGDIVQDILRFQSQCANMTFADQIRYNIMFHQVLHKGGYSAIKYIKILQ